MRRLSVEELQQVAGGRDGEEEVVVVSATRPIFSGFNAQLHMFNTTGFVPSGEVDLFVVTGERRGDERDSGGWNWNRLHARGIQTEQQAISVCNRFAAVRTRAENMGSEVASLTASALGTLLGNTPYTRAAGAFLAGLAGSTGAVQAEAINAEMAWMGCPNAR